MAKETGLGWTAMSVADSAGNARDIKNDITNMQFATPRGVQDVTGIDKFAFERLLLLADMSFTWNGVFNNAANQSHSVFKDASSASATRAVFTTISGQTLGAVPAVSLIITDYAMTRSPSGEFTWQVPAVLANGVVPTWS